MNLFAFQMSTAKNALVVWVLTLLCLVTPKAGAASLTRLDFDIVGEQLRVSPSALSVPKDIAGSVRVDVSGVDVPQGAVVQATLRGPSLATLTLIGQPGSPLLLPPLRVVGDYQLDQIRLMVPAPGGGGLVPVLEGSPSSIPIRVFDEVLVSRVTSRPLTGDEIKEKGIFIDEKNFRAVEFEVGFVLDGKTIPVRFPVVSPAFRQSTEIIPAAELEARLKQASEINQQIGLGTSLPKELQAAQVNIDIQGFNFQFVEEGEQDLALKIPPIPALMVIPGNIGFLNQFFSVQVFTENAAPLDSGLSVFDVTAQLRLPSGPDLVPSTSFEDPGDDPLRFARVGASRTIQPTQPILRPGPDGKLGTQDDVGRLFPGESGQAEFLVEGLQEGLHVMDLDLTASLEGLAAGVVKIKGKAAGSVLVRNPKFSMAFSHPRTIRAGEPYDAYVTILNTSQTPANEVSITLPSSAVSGAVLESDPIVTLGTLIPGQTATAKFRLRSQRTGSISFSNFSSSDDRLQGRFRLRMGVDERGVALSPDSLAFPEFASALPTQVLDAANRVLGQALSVATAAQLPQGVQRVSRSAITSRILELAEAGQRVRYGDPLRRVLPDLLFDWMSGRSLDAGFDQIVRETDAGREWREALAGAMEQDDARPATARLLERLPDLSGRGEGWAIVASDRVEGSYRFGPPSGTTEETNGALLYRAVSGPQGQWLIRPLSLPLELEWKPGSAVAAGDIVLALVGTNGLTTQHRWTHPALASGSCLRIRAGSTSPTLEIDQQCDGQLEEQIAAATQEIRESAPELVSVRQDISVDAGRPRLSCFLRALPTRMIPSKTESDVGNYGTVVAVLFSKPMSQESINLPGAYRLDNGNEAAFVQIQPGGRVALLTLKQPVGGIRSRVMTLSGIADVRGNPIREMSRPVLTDLTAGVAVKGQVVRADGNPAVGVPVTLTMHDQMDAGLSGCIPFVVRVTQVFTDAQGAFSFDYVLPGIPYVVSATDTSGLTPELIQIILGATTADEFSRQQLLELANSASVKDSLLAEFAVGALPEAVAKAEGLDRAVLRDLIPENSARLGSEVPVALRFRGRGTVSGQVVSSDGVTPIPGTAVNLFPDPDSRELGRGVFADASGRFAFSGVPLGQFSLQADTGTGLTRTLSGVFSTPGESTNVLVVLSRVSEARTRLEGRVTENDNTTPHAGATVFLGRFGQTSSQLVDVVAAVTSDADGLWRAIDVPARTYDVVAVANDGRRRGDRRNVSAVAGATNFISIALQGFGVVVGRVEFSDGRPIRNALVGGGDSVVRTDVNGLFRLTGVPTGLRQISAGVERSTEQAPPKSTPASPFPRVGSTELNVIPGVENFAVIRLEPRGTIQGTVRDASGRPVGSGAVAIPESGGFRWVPVNAQGFYRFEGLELGDHTLSAPAPPAENTDVTGILRTLGSEGASQAQIQAAIGEAVAIFTGANNPLLNGQGAAFNPLSWGFTKVSLSRDGEVITRDVQFFGVSTIAGTILNGQGVPIGARVRLTGVGPTANGMPSFVIRGERNSDPALGTFEFAGQALVGDWGLQAASPFFPVVISTSGLTAPLTPDATNVVLQFPRDRESKGRIAGRVLNPEGGPMSSDVLVSIPFGTGFVTNRTRADGSFGGEIGFPAINENGQPGVGYRLEALDEATGRKGVTDIIALPAMTNVATIQLIDNQGALRVRVVRADGSPAPRAQVDVDGGSYPFLRGLRLLAGLDGVAVFQNLFDGPYSLGGQFSTGTSLIAGRASGVAQSGRTNEVILTLGPTAGISGVFVRADRATPVGFAQVAVGSIGFATTRSDGRFEMQGIPLGSYRLLASDPVTGLAASGFVTLSKDGETQSVVLVEQGRGEVRGLVIGNYGTNVAPGLKVTLAVPDGITAARSVTTGPDGSFSFPGTPVGSFTLSVDDPITGNTRVTQGQLNEGVGSLEVQFTLEPLATLSVTLLEPDGKTPVTTGLGELVRGGRSFAVASPGADGIVTFSDIALGQISFSARSLKTLQTHSVVRVPIELKEGLNRVRISLNGVGAVAGSLLQSDGVTPVVGGTVTLTSQSESLPSDLTTAEIRLTDAQGKFRFEDVAVGGYRLSGRFLSLGALVSGSLDQSGEQDTVVLKLNPSGSIEGRLVRADRVTPVAVASVLLRYGGTFAATATDAAGRFRLENIPLGSFSLEATAGLFDGVQRRSGTLGVNGQTIDFADIVLDEEPPRVVAVNPADGSAGVLTTTPILIDFSEALNPDSMETGGTFLRLGTNRVPAQVKLEAQAPGGLLNRVRVTPEQPLLSERTYEVVVVNGELRDAVGNVSARGPRDEVDRPLTLPFVSRFTTADQDPPDLVSVFPTNQSVQVELQTILRWTFNEPIRPSNVVVRVVGASGPVEGTVAFGLGGLSLVFAPAVALPANEQFTASVSNVVDLAGNPASGEPLVSRFDTLDTRGPLINPLRVVGTRPLVAGSLVTVETDLVIDEPGARLRFSQDGGGLLTVTQRPYRAEIRLPASGATTIAAAASDRFGNLGNQEILVLSTVSNTPPSVALRRVSPATGPAINGSSVVIEVEALDDLEVTNVLVAVSGAVNRVQTISGPFPSRVTVDLPASLSVASPLRLDARAFDTLGVASLDTSLVIPVEIHPAPTLSAPSSFTLAEGQITNFVVSAADADGKLSRLLVEPTFAGSESSGWSAEFRNLTFTPSSLAQINFDSPATLTTNVAVIDFPSTFSAPWPVGRVQSEQVASRFTGQLVVEKSGEHEFKLISDDGSEVRVDGVVVASRDNGSGQVSARVSLAAGFHPIEVRHFNGGGPGGLRVLWTRPGAAEEPVPAIRSPWSVLQFTESHSARLDLPALLSATNAHVELQTEVLGTNFIRLVAVDADGLIATASVQVVVLADLDRDGIPDVQDPDMDGDGLSNDRERELGTDPRKADTDGDSIADGLDPKPLIPNRRPVAGFLVEAAAGRAVNLDGVDDRLAGPLAFPEISRTFTMELWANPTGPRRETSETALGVDGIGGMAYAIFPDHAGGLSGSSHAGAGLAIGTNGVSVAEHTVDYLPLLLVHKAPITGWTHVAVVYQDNRPSLYINGVFVRRGLQSILTVHPSSTLSVFAPYGAYAGAIDEVRVWSRALTEAEIQEGMGRRMHGIEPGLVSCLSMDDTSGDFLINTVPGAAALNLDPGNTRPAFVDSGARLSDFKIQASIAGLRQAITLSGSDPDGDLLKARVISLPTHGRLFQTVDGVTPGAPILQAGTEVVNPSRVVLFQRTALFEGSDRFLYEVRDGVTNSASAVVDIQLSAPAGFDTDGDGIPDAYELANGLDGLVNDAGQDLDHDGLSNIVEFRRGTRADVADTDGDGIADGLDLNPLISDAALSLVSSVYARAKDPVQLAFAVDGTLFLGVDASGSGGGSGDAVKILRVRPGGGIVDEYGASPIADPDGVAVDGNGRFSGVAGSILVSGSDNGGGFVMAVRPDQSLITVFASAGDFLNPSPLKFDHRGNLLFADFSTPDRSGIWRSQSPTDRPKRFIGLPGNSAAMSFAVDLDNTLWVIDRLGVLRQYSDEGALMRDQVATGLDGGLIEFPPPVFGTNLWVLQNGSLLELNLVTGGKSPLMSGLPTTAVDIVAGPGQSLYVADFENDQILRISRTEPGFFSASFRNGSLNPVDGSLYGGVDDSILVSHGGSFESGNFGGRGNMEVGTYSDNSIRRGLLRFDIRSLDSVAARFTSAKVRLAVTDSGALGDGADVQGSGRVQLFGLSDANADWVEGTRSSSLESPESGSVSWNSKRFGVSAWAGAPGAGSAGVDFALPSLAGRSFGPQTQKGSFLEWDLGDLSLIRRWARQTNAGMVVRTEAERGLNILSFATSESSDVATRPELTVSYEPSITSSDLWDVHRGTVVTASSGAGAGPLENMFGAQLFSVEPGNALFSDGRPAGATHFVEWRTARPIRLRAFHLQAMDDGGLGARGVRLFTLLARDSFTGEWLPLHRSAPLSNPYPADPSTGASVFDLTADVTPTVASEFRAEFVQAPNTLLAPRIVELDGFGDALSLETVAATDTFTWRAIAPFGNLEATPLASAGISFDQDHPGWNSQLAFDDSESQGWHTPALRGSLNGLTLIWSDDPPRLAPTPAFFRKKFVVPADLRVAMLSYFADDDAAIWINGRLVVEDTNNVAGGRSFIDVTSFLVPGLNLIAAKAHDSFAGAPLGQNGESFSLAIDVESGGTNCIAPPQGLLSWWRGEGDAFDSVGLSQGTLSGGVGFGPGAVGDAFVFDGTGSSISLGTASALRRTNAATYAFWALLPPGGGGEAMGAGAGGGQGFGGILLRSNAISFQWTPSQPQVDAQLISREVSIPSDQWVHVAVSIDFAQRAGALYLNGKLVPSVVSNFLNLPIQSWIPDGRFNEGRVDSIGGRLVNTPVPFRGALDEVQVYERALSESEIAAIAGAGSRGLCLDCLSPLPGLIAYWDMDPVAPEFPLSKPEAISLFTPSSLTVTGKSGNGRRLPAGTLMSTSGGGVLNLVHDQLTIEAWVLLERNPDSSQRFTGTIGKNQFPAGQPFVLLFESGSNVGLPQDQWLMEYVVTRQDGFRAHNQSTGIRLTVDGRYHHVAMTYDGASVVLYVDGVAKGSFPFSGLLLPVPEVPFVVSAGLVPFSIDGLAVYSRALTPAEILLSASRSGSPRCYDCLPAPEGMVSLWGADPVVEGLVFDQGFISSGVLVNGARNGAGVHGAGLFFDGVDDRVRIPFSGAFSSPVYTATLWVNPVAPVQDSFSQELLFGQPLGAPQLTVRPGVNGLRVVSGFRSGSQGGNSTFHEMVSDTSIPFNQFTHVATTWDGVRLRLYFNGTLVQESQPGVTPVFSSHPFFLGGFGAEPPVPDAAGYPDQQHWNGYLDEVALWNRALSPAEIAQIAQAGAAGFCKPQQQNVPPLAETSTPSATPLPVSIQFTMSQEDGDQTRMTLTWTDAVPGSIYLIEGSTDLQQWQPVSVQVFAESGGIFHARIPIKNTGSEFFRVRRSASVDGSR